MRNFSKLFIQRSTDAVLVVTMVFLGVCTAFADEDLPQVQYFTQHVLPLLEEHCFDCHSHASGEANGNLLLDSRAAMTVGGSRGSVIDQNTPSKSLLLIAVMYQNSELQMPPSQKLDDRAIAVLQTWLEQGAPMPSSMQANAQEQSQLTPALSAAQHWAYLPPQPWKGQAASKTNAPYESNNFVDAIVTAGLAKEKLSLSQPADRATLLRRLTYDLSGLPPTLAETLQFVNDPRTDEAPIGEAIDRLLSSPHFGERWARFWMDVSRYADNKGYVFQEDREYAEAYKYRDWLINAFNLDTPYDEFLTQQLAADLIAPATASGVDYSDIPALGFLTLGRRFLNNRHDIIDDRLDVVARGLLGMTLGCARCHDHKYDPISQADYYGMFGVFLNTDEPGGEPWAHRLIDASDQRESFILLRGNPSNRGEKVERRFVSLLAPQSAPYATGSGRAELAAQIAAAENPLTARVFANRVWMVLTGSSLVESPSDFGLRCPPPKQLELLDQLALYLIAENWSIKSLIRAVVSSRVYQQSSQHDKASYSVDPLNSLYWRMNRRRLDFESLRDTLLERSGLLDLSIHGKSERISVPPYSRRRTVYAYIDRQNLPQVFRTFDLASPDTHTPVRAQTSVPQQGLFLLNSDFMAELSDKLAERARLYSEDRRQQARWMFKQVFCRQPSNEEFDMVLEFVSPSDEPSKSQAARLSQLAGAFLAANELAHVD